MIQHVLFWCDGLAWTLLLSELNSHLQVGREAGFNLSVFFIVCEWLSDAKQISRHTAITQILSDSVVGDNMLLSTSVLMHIEVTQTHGYRNSEEEYYFPLEILFIFNFNFL